MFIFSQTNQLWYKPQNWFKAQTILEIKVKYFLEVITFTLLFSHLADAFIQSDLQIRKSNYN